MTQLEVRLTQRGPLDATLLSAGAGVFFLFGVFSTLNSPYVKALHQPLYGANITALGVIGTTCAALALLGGIVLYFWPAQRRGWSIAIITSSFLSFIGAGGGLLIGFTMGIMAVAIGVTRKQRSPLRPQILRT